VAKKPARRSPARTSAPAQPGGAGAKSSAKRAAGAAPRASAATRATARRLRPIVRDIARVAAVMFDGELAKEIVTDRSWKWMANFDPKDRWSSMDNYDVEHGPFLAAKHTLLRLERLAPPGVRVQCLLWTPVPTLPGQATVVIWNGGPSRFWQWGKNHLDATPEMRAALDSGELQDVAEAGSGVVTVLAPVRDSLKEVSGFIEVSASAVPAAINW
jgi:hypothetical protein